MRILYVATKYDYNDPARGYSFGHHNFFETLRRMGPDLLYFDFGTLMKTLGVEEMNRRLTRAKQEFQPDVVFVVMWNDEFDPSVIRGLSDGKTQTVAWFSDDHWRFDNYSSRWAPHFDWVTTTDSLAPVKYRKIGYTNVIKTQWACNHFVYRKLDAPLEHDVTFVGIPHTDRRDTIAALRAAGFDARAWGQGWETGRLSQEEMIRVFNASRINLNLSSSSVAIESKLNPLRRVQRRAAAAAIRAVPGAWRIGALHKVGLPRFTFLRQIKGRNFEIPGCGGFQLTQMADNLGDYYQPGREIACFESRDDLIEKVRHYLSHESEREAIAEAGYRRTLREHTYVHRFCEIFERIGFRGAADEARRGEGVRQGVIQEAA